MSAGGSLAKADIAPFSDLSRALPLPRLSSMAPTIGFPGVGVKFAGDTYATPFRGEGETASWDLMVRYSADEQAQLVELLALFKEVANSPDVRLFLRTAHGLVPGLDVAQAVVVFDVKPLPQFGHYYDLTFTANAVEYTLEV